MANAVGTMARLKNGGTYVYHEGDAGTAVDAYGPGVVLEIRPVGEVFELETLATLQAPIINQPMPIVLTEGSGWSENMALRVSGGTPPFSFHVVEAAPLPAGVTTNGQNISISDQMTVGNYSWAIRVTDNNVDPQSATIAYALQVRAAVAETPQWTVLSDQIVVIDNVTPSSGMVNFSITEPAVYAGNYAVSGSLLEQGPVCLVPPEIDGLPQDNALISARAGLWASLSQIIDITHEWHRGDAPIQDETVPAYMVDVDLDGGLGLTYLEIARDGAGERFAESNSLLIDSAPAAEPLGWYPPEWIGSTSSSIKAQYETLPDGRIMVSHSRPLDGDQNFRGYFDIVPGTSYELDTEIEFGNASRIICRMSDTTGNNTGMNVLVFDVTKAEGQGVLSRRGDLFTPSDGRVALHYVFILPRDGVSYILPATRVREVI